MLTQEQLADLRNTGLSRELLEVIELRGEMPTRVGSLYDAELYQFADGTEVIVTNAGIVTEDDAGWHELRGTIPTDADLTRRICIISSLNDLRNWVDNRTADDEVDAIADAIRDTCDCPAWGDDWSEFLESLPDDLGELLAD